VIGLLADITAQTAGRPIPLRVAVPDFSPEKKVVRVAGVEPALLSELDFESSASTNCGVASLAFKAGETAQLAMFSFR
jgi:hypothetical protein